MNQNRGKDNDLQRAIDEITQKSATPKPATQTPATPVSNPMPPAPAAAAPAPVPMSEPAPMRPMEMPKPQSRPAMSNSMPMGGYAPRVGGDVSKVKEAALKELFPLMNRVEVEPEKRFELFREMLETMRDKAVISPAYEAARQIRDDTVRANALLYLINTIEEMNF